MEGIWEFSSTTLIIQLGSPSSFIFYYDIWFCTIAITIECQRGLGKKNKKENEW